MTRNVFQNQTSQRGFQYQTLFCQTPLDILTHLLVFVSHKGSPNTFKIRQNMTRYLAEKCLITHNYSPIFNNYISSSMTNGVNYFSSFFKHNRLLHLYSIICLQHLSRTTLFQLICSVFAVHSGNKNTGRKIRPCMEHPRLYGIYRLAVNQSGFSKPCLFESVITPAHKETAR